MAAELFFSEDLVAAILVRVPGKHLIRFKSVCKQWNVLISDSDFTKSHLKTTTSLKNIHNRMLLFFHGRKNLGACLSTSRIKTEFFDENPDVSLLELKEEKKEHPLDPYSIISGVMHCDGLLCIYVRDEETRNRNMVVWNPLTKQHKMFGTSKNTRYLFDWDAFGFGYDSSIDDYKAVHVIVRGDFMNSSPLKIQILRLKNGLWEDDVQIDISNSIFISEINAVGKFVNGRVYWIANEKSRSSEIIVCFDLEKNMMREETSPPPDQLVGLCHDLGVLEGSLCLGKKSCLRGMVRMDIWVMKEDGLSGTKIWTRLFRVEDNNSTLGTSFMTFTPRGKMITMARSRTIMCLTNPNEKQKSVRRIQVHDGKAVTLFCFWVYMVEYEESLISPNA